MKNQSYHDDCLEFTPAQLKPGMLFQVKKDSGFYVHKCLRYPLDTWGWYPPKGWARSDNAFYLQENEVIMLIDVAYATHQSSPCARGYVYLIFLWREQKLWCSYEHNRYGGDRELKIYGLNLLENHGAKKNND